MADCESVVNLLKTEGNVEYAGPPVQPGGAVEASLILQRAPGWPGAEWWENAIRWNVEAFAELGKRGGPPRAEEPEKRRKR